MCAQALGPYFSGVTGADDESSKPLFSRWKCDLEAAVQLKYTLKRLLPNYTSFLTLLRCQMFSSFAFHAKVREDLRPLLKSFAKPPPMLGANDSNIRSAQN